MFNLKEIHKEGARSWFRLVNFHDFELPMINAIDATVRRGGTLSDQQYSDFANKHRGFLLHMLGLADKLEMAEYCLRDVFKSNDDLEKIIDTQGNTIFHYYALGQALNDESAALQKMKDIREKYNLNFSKRENSKIGSILHFLAFAHPNAAIALGLSKESAWKAYAYAGRVHPESKSFKGHTLNLSIYHNLAEGNNTINFDFDADTVNNFVDKFGVTPKQYIRTLPDFLPKDELEIQIAFNGDLYYFYRAMKRDLKKSYDKNLWHAFAAGGHINELNIAISKKYFDPDQCRLPNGETIWHTLAKNLCNHGSLLQAANRGMFDYATCLDNSGNPVPLPYFMDLSKTIKLKSNAIDAAVLTDELAGLSFVDGGIDHKYIGIKLPELPNLAVKAAPRSKFKYQQSCEFKYLNKLSNNTSSSSMEIVRNEYKLNSDLCDISLLSTQCDLQPNDKVVFIHAGRKNDALLPNPDNTCRVVLVATMAEYNEYKKNLSSNIDVLIISKINSKTHGDYKDALGSLNARRLAVLLYTFDRKLNSCLCLDDNLEKIIFNPVIEKDDTRYSISDVYAVFENEVQTGNKPVLAGMATASNVMNADYSRSFCCKAHFWDLKAVFELFTKPDQLVYLALPAKDSFNWGEDYVQQIMLHALFDDSDRKAYQVTDPAIIAMERSSQHQNAFKKTGKLASNLLAEDVLKFTNKEGHDRKLLALAEYAFANLKNIVQSNLDIYKNGLEKVRNANLFKEHARANNVVYQEIRNQKQIANGPFGTLWLDKLRSNLDKMRQSQDKTNGFLRPYQCEAIEALLNTESSMAKFLMATGTGKTMVQIALAANALSVNPGKPIIIVTPSRELVQQFFYDFKEKYPEIQKNIPNLFSMQQILMVDSEPNHTSVEALKINEFVQGKSCVLIFCLASYMRLLEKNQGQPSYLKEAPLVMLDEYHKYSPEQLSTIKKANKSNNTLLYGFTATPPAVEHDIFTRCIFNYTRQRAEAEGYICPLKIRKLANDYDVNTSDDQRNQQFANILKSQHMSRDIENYKIVVYLPRIKNIVSMFAFLQTMGYTAHVAGSPATGKKVYQVHTGAGSPADSLDNFKDNDGPCIVLACGQLQVGFSCNTVVIAVVFQGAQNSNTVTQIGGRVIRRDKFNPEKVGLLIVHNDANLSGLEVEASSSPLIFSANVARRSSAIISSSAAVSSSSAGVSSSSAFKKRIIDSSSEEEEIEFTNPTSAGIKRLCQ